MNIEIGLVGKHAKSILLDFDAGGVEYTMRMPEAGRVMASGGEWVVIKNLLLPQAAKLLNAWLSHGSTRRLNVTLPDNRVIMAEAPSVEEVERLMGIAKQILLMDTSNAPGQTPKPKRS
jgi:hypothetical protein